MRGGRLSVRAYNGNMFFVSRQVGVHPEGGLKVEALINGILRYTQRGDLYLQVACRLSHSKCNFVCNLEQNKS